MTTKDKTVEGAVKKAAGNSALAPLHDYGADAGAGFQGQTGDDYSMPFLALLQDLSPQVKGAGKIEGAEPGLLFNTVSGEIADEVNFIPALTEHVFVEWIPRKQGGGFVGKHPPSSEIVQKAKAASTAFGHYETPEGNGLQETFYVYGVLDLGDGRVEPVAIAFASTKITVYKKWMTRVKLFTLDGRTSPPLFAHQVVISGARQSNRQGQEFYNLQIEPAGDSIRESLLSPEDPRFLAAKAIGQLVKSGQARVDYAAAGEESEQEVF